MARNNLVSIVVVTSYLLFGHETSLQEEVNFLINTNGRIPAGYEPATILDAVKYRFQLDKALKKVNADKFEVRSKYIYAPGGKMPIMMSTNIATGKSDEETYNLLGMAQNKSEDEELTNAAIENIGNSEEGIHNSLDMAQNKSEDEEIAKAAVEMPGHLEEPTFNSSTMAQNKSEDGEQIKAAAGPPEPLEVPSLNASTMAKNKLEDEVHANASLEKQGELRSNPSTSAQNMSKVEEQRNVTVGKPGPSEEPLHNTSTMVPNKIEVDEHTNDTLGKPGFWQESRSNPFTLAQNVSKVEEQSNVTIEKPGPSEASHQNMSTMTQNKDEGEEKTNVVRGKPGGADEPPGTSSNKSQNISNVEEHVVVGQEQIDHTGFAWRWTCKKDNIPLRGQSDLNDTRHAVKCIDACHDHCLGYCPHYCCGVDRNSKKCHPYCQRSCPIMYTKPCLQFTECFGLVKDRTDGVYQQHGTPRHSHGKVFRKHKFPKIKHKQYTQE